VKSSSSSWGICLSSAHSWRVPFIYFLFVTTMLLGESLGDGMFHHLYFVFIWLFLPHCNSKNVLFQLWHDDRVTIGYCFTAVKQNNNDILHNDKGLYHYTIYKSFLFCLCILQVELIVSLTVMVLYAIIWNIYSNNKSPQSRTSVPKEWITHLSLDYSSAVLWLMKGKIFQIKVF
jgi:hypothetical protein